MADYDSAMSLIPDADSTMNTSPAPATDWAVSAWENMKQLIPLLRQKTRAFQLQRKAQTAKRQQAENEAQSRHQARIARQKFQADSRRWQCPRCRIEPHEAGGLYEILTYWMPAMMEFRINIQYGQYLADHLPGFQRPTRDQVPWPQLWKEISVELDEERDLDFNYMVQKYHTPHHAMPPPPPPPHLPFLDQIDAAAQTLGLSRRDVCFELDGLAGLSDASSHLPIAELVRGCYFHTLANRIWHDAKLAGFVYWHRPREREALMRCLFALRRDWYRDIFEDRGRVVAVISEKAETRMRKIYEQRLATGSVVLD
ncbi:MAG: hypothetical protein M1819_001207 [Sarea resinae]|nr:MAG: hypothetical protein M1819_001207 [Sarea resinae]